MKALGTLLAVFLFLFIATGEATAKDRPAGSRHPQLIDATAYTGREGGETIADAVEIHLPFLGHGNTADNFDDHDAVCPYSGSTSPDVVYTFTVDSDTRVRVDLCGSSYDTKTYIYDQDLNLLGCNDDYYTDPVCGVYVSLLEGVVVSAGQRYYVVVDGYGGDAGEYLILVEWDCWPPPCIDAECPEDGVPENEPPLADDYVDLYNSGCNVDPPLFQELLPLEGTDGLTFCGQTGWFPDGGSWLRDEDWLVMTAAGENIHVETNSTHYLWTRCDVLFLDDCHDVSTLEYQMGVCEPGIIDIPTQPGDMVFLRVMPVHEEPGECAPLQDLYTLQISGITTPVVETGKLGFDALKCLYR